MAVARPIVLFLMLVGLVCGQGFGSCYLPGGAYAPGYFPCHPHAVTSLCCPTGWTCFSNLQCIATDPSIVSNAIPLGTAIRGTCENPGWDDAACGNFCLNEPVRNNNGSLKPCGGNRWCCQPESDSGLCNCDSGVGTFSLSSGVAQTIIGVDGLQHTSTGSLSSQSTSAVRSSSTSSASASSSLSSSLSTLQSTTSSSRPSSTASSTGSSSTVSSTTSSSATPTAATPSPSVTNTLGFKLGLGISIPLLAIAAFAIWWFLVRHRHRPESPMIGLSDSSDWTPPNPGTTQLHPQPPILPVPHPYENRPAANQQPARAPSFGRRGSLVSGLPVIPERNPDWTVRRPVPNRDSYGQEREPVRNRGDYGYEREPLSNGEDYGHDREP